MGDGVAVRDFRKGLARWDLRAARRDGSRWILGTSRGTVRLDLIRKGQKDSMRVKLVGIVEDDEALLAFDTYLLLESGTATVLARGGPRDVLPVLSELYVFTEELFEPGPRMVVYEGATLLIAYPRPTWWKGGAWDHLLANPPRPGLVQASYKKVHGKHAFQWRGRLPFAASPIEKESYSM